MQGNSCYYILVNQTNKSITMKNRVRKIANFFAFNLLFFALYLNFIHKDQHSSENVGLNEKPKAAAFSGTVLVEHPEKYLHKK